MVKTSPNFPLSRPQTKRADNYRLPFGLVKKGNLANEPIIVTPITPTPPKPLPVAQTRLGIAMNCTAFNTTATAVATCQNLLVKTTPLTQKLSITHTTPMPIWACEWVKIGAFGALASCYNGKFTPIGKQNALASCVTPIINPAILLTHCQHPNTVQTVQLNGCVAIFSDKIHPLFAKLTPIGTNTVKLADCTEQVNEGKPVTACQALKTVPAVGVPCRYYPLPPPPLPPSLQVCPIRPPSDRLPFRLTRKRGKFEPYALPFGLHCWHNHPNPDDNPTNPTNPKNPTPKTGYIMHHTITATIGGLAIDPLSFSIKTDIQSFCWQGQIEIPQKDFDKLNKTGKLY